MLRNTKSLFACLLFSLPACGTSEGGLAPDADAAVLDAGSDVRPPPDHDAGPAGDAAPPPDAGDGAADSSEPDSGGADGGACLALFAQCKASDTCCAGSCGGGFPNYVQCLLRPGDPCELPSGSKVIDNCGPSTVCDPATLKCVLPSCWSRGDDATAHAGSKDSSYCDTAPSVHCCDPLTVCQTDMIGSPHPIPLTRCCVPDGTAMPDDEQGKCCSYAVGTGVDGIKRCIPPVPHP